MIKSAALSLRHAILEKPFDLDDKFCDADDLQSFMKHLRQTYEITQCGKSSISMFEKFLLVLPKFSFREND